MPQLAPAVGLARRLGIPTAGFIHVPAPAEVPLERQESIFSAFASTKRTGAHIGLGLANGHLFG